MKSILRNLAVVFRKLSAYHKAYSNDFLWPLVLPLRQLQLKQIAKNIAQNFNCGTILDVGTGYGYLAIEIALRHPSAQLLGIDVEPALIKDGKNRSQGKVIANRISFLIASAEFLPFSDNSMDMVVSTMSLHLWHNQESGIAEIHRVLKQGRQVLILMDRHCLLRGFTHITDYFTKQSISKMESHYLSIGFAECHVTEQDELLKIVAIK